MYEKAIWPPKPIEPPRPTLEEGMVIRHANGYFVVVRTLLGMYRNDYVDALRLFEIGHNGRLRTYNRHSDLQAMETDYYKTCAAIWRTVADFVADMELESGTKSTGAVPS